MVLLKAITGMLALVLMVIFLGVVVVKVKEIALVVVLLIGMGFMIWEYIESLRHRDE
ncbi:MAG: hypothetical protein ACOZDY_13055 [Pseudomonadota bacterium]